ncbi:MAG: hypothetical protein IKP00_14875 [Victivallales bacterium]|nr:hypothetical protein [Victivallales bacterium]
MAGVGRPIVVANVDDVNTNNLRLNSPTATGTYVHTDMVYVALMTTIKTMEDRLAQSLENYQAHPDVQANLQQLQYDLQQWNLALTTMTNINKNLGDALNSIASNFR